MALDQNNKHTPVLLHDIILFISAQAKTHSKTIIYDGTFGGGGYTQQLLDFGSVRAVDADIEALSVGEKLFVKEISTGQLIVKHSSFDKGLELYPDKYYDYIIADLGFSSNQLNDSNRGFSYQKLHETLDLRYNREKGGACWQLLYCVEDVDKLTRIIYNYSGESLSKRISESIFSFINTQRPKQRPITVGQIVAIIMLAIPIREKKYTNKILSRVWQSFRIWTNNEFEVLQNFLNIGVSKLKVNGFLMVVSFHSLEDKIVTKFMRGISKPLKIDDYGNKTFDFELVTKKAFVPSKTEIDANPRSRSAILRIVKKIA